MATAKSSGAPASRKTTITTNAEAAAALRTAGQHLDICPDQDQDEGAQLFGEVLTYLEAGPVPAATGDHPLLAAWRELLAAIDVFNAEPEDDEPAAVRSRIRELEEQIETARPDDLTGLAVQLRYLEHSLDIGSNETQPELVSSIATTLSRLGGVEVERNPRIRGWGDAS